MTTNDELLTREAAAEGVNRVRMAVHPLGGHPQAQRRWLQMGFMRSIATLEHDAGRFGEFVAAGAATEDQAQLVAEALSAFQAVKASRGDDPFYGEASRTRAFLLSDAFEEDDWSDLRFKARSAFAALNAGRGNFIDP